MYIDILERTFTDTYNIHPGYLYQQDNHPAHTSKKTKKYFSDNNIIVIDLK